jgi:membrane protein YqaA with SNARE-associated domain
MGLAKHPKAVLVLAFISFIESSVFPIPPDVILIPMIIAAPKRAFFLAAVTMVSSVAGGLFGYMLGAFAFEQIAQPILLSMGKADAIAAYAERFNGAGFWAVLGAGITPFPFKVITIMSGASAMPLGLFISTAILARTLRFFTVALLLRVYGEPIRDFIERYLGWTFLAFLGLLVLGFWGTKWM